MGEGALRDAKMGMPLYRPDTPVQVCVREWLMIFGARGRSSRPLTATPTFPATFPATPSATLPVTSQVLTCPWRDPVLIGGYYLKTRRGVSNSPFFVDGERQGTTSVQEAIGDLVQAAMKAEVCERGVLCVV